MGRRLGKFLTWAPPGGSRDRSADGDQEERREEHHHASRPPLDPQELHRRTVAVPASGEGQVLHSNAVDLDEVDLTAAHAYPVGSMTRAAEIGIRFFGFLAPRIFAR